MSVVALDSSGTWAVGRNGRWAVQPPGERGATRGLKVGARRVEVPARWTPWPPQNRRAPGARPPRGSPAARRARRRAGSSRATGATGGMGGAPCGWPGQRVSTYLGGVVAAVSGRGARAGRLREAGRSLDGGGLRSALALGLGARRLRGRAPLAALLAASLPGRRRWRRARGHTPGALPEAEATVGVAGGAAAPVATGGAGRPRGLRVGTEAGCDEAVSARGSPSAIGTP